MTNVRHDTWWLVAAKVILVFCVPHNTVLVAILLLGRDGCARSQLGGPKGALQSLADVHRWRQRASHLRASIDLHILWRRSFSVGSWHSPPAFIPFGPRGRCLGHRTPL